jgi:hypothetical protein
VRNLRSYKERRNAPDFEAADLRECADANMQVRMICRSIEMAELAEIVVRDYHSLIDALIAQKNALGISHEQLEHICGLTRGHVDKVLGRARNKAIGKWLLGILLEGLALELVPRVNPNALKRMATRYQRRNEKQIRNCQPVSQALLDKCRPIILAELGRRGAAARARQQHRNGRHSGNGANGHRNGHAANGHANGHAAAK